MTRKNARKTAARARQEKTGGSYQAALRTEEPKPLTMHDEFRVFFTSEILQNRKLASVLVGPIDYADMRKYLPPVLVPVNYIGSEGHMADYGDVKILVDKNQPESRYTLAHVGGRVEEINASSPLHKIRALNQAVRAPDLAKRVREAFMVLNSGLGFTGHLAPTREQLMGRIQRALQILAPPEDAVMQSLRHHRFPFDVTEDIHTATAMLGSTREGAKEINAALIYGSSGSPPGFAITETRDIEVVERALDGSIREMRPVPGSERVTITRMPFRVEDLSQLRALEGAKRCTAPKLRLIGVTDGTIVRWATLTSARKDHEFSAWWRSLPVAAPYSRFENDER